MLLDTLFLQDIQSDDLTREKPTKLHEISEWLNIRSENHENKIKNQ